VHETAGTNGGTNDDTAARESTSTKVEEAKVSDRLTRGGVTS